MSNITEKSFDSQAIFENKYLKVKLKYYEGKNNTFFIYKKVPKENVDLLCRAAMVLDSVCRIKKNYYPQTFVEQCKYKIY